MYSHLWNISTPTLGVSPEYQHPHGFPLPPPYWHRLTATISIQKENRISVVLKQAFEHFFIHSGRRANTVFDVQSQVGHSKWYFFFAIVGHVSVANANIICTQMQISNASMSSNCQSNPLAPDVAVAGTKSIFVLHSVIKANDHHWQTLEFLTFSPQLNETNVDLD